MLHLREADFIPPQEPLRARRLNIFSGGSKRRIFSADDKARIVAESYESGRSVCAVARRHGLMAAQLFAWRKNARLRQEETRLAQAEGFGDEERRDEDRVRPLGLAISADAADGRKTSAQATPIEITIGAVTVRVPQGFDAVTLKAVLQAINATP
ncbi:IS66-like element accessory protein TnpA [Methylocapsa aurea]|uniref:IS66-like element accessory protein TnpA n=1 Tax=Methylocapsa aurea TaxID=663610 RepID=UPI00068E8040|nr:transposase [Methylocapsa aurea]